MCCVSVSHIQYKLLSLLPSDFNFLYLSSVLRPFSLTAHIICKVANHILVQIPTINVAFKLEQLRTVTLSTKLDL